MSRGLEYLEHEDDDDFEHFEKIRHRPKTMNDDGEVSKKKKSVRVPRVTLEFDTDDR